MFWQAAKGIGHSSRLKSLYVSFSTFFYHIATLTLGDLVCLFMHLSPVLKMMLLGWMRWFSE